MEPIQNTLDLKNNILLLRTQQIQEYASLKNNFSNTLESIKPINILRNNIESIELNSDFKKKAFKTLAFIAVLFAAKILITEKHQPLFKKTASLLIETILSNLLSKRLS